MQFQMEIPDDYVPLVADAFLRAAPMPVVNNIEVAEDGTETVTPIPFTLDEKLANARSAVIAYIQAVVRQHQLMTAQEEAAAALEGGDPVPIQ